VLDRARTTHRAVDAPRPDDPAGDRRGVAVSTSSAVTLVRSSASRRAGRAAVHGPGHQPRAAHRQADRTDRDDAAPSRARRPVVAAPVAAAAMRATGAAVGS
jgi:hypothetical protein